MTFLPQTLPFLQDMALNNSREWFQEHRADYDLYIRQPSLSLIRSLRGPLASLSPHFTANDHPSRGSLMRVHRDSRFARDQGPLKTNIGIQFRHSAGKDVHAPGLYIHIEPAPAECFLGAGLWHPPAPALADIRAALIKSPDAWLTTRNAPTFTALWSLSGDSLRTAPRGLSPTHPLIEDLRRKDHIATTPLSPASITSQTLPDLIAAAFEAAAPYMRFLCTALKLPF